MLRVLTLSTLFPNAARPTLGLFVARQTRGLAARDDVDLRVVAPLGVPVWPLSRHPHYRDLAGLPGEEDWHGLVVHHPRYRVWPKMGAAGTADRLAAALLPRLRTLRTRFAFDVIDAEFFWPDGPAAMRLAAALGLPFSIKARGSDIHFWGRQPGISEQIAAAGRAADGLLAVSGQLRDEMAELGMPAERIRVHHTGIDLDLFRPVDRAAAKAALGVSGPLLVCAGALIERKGQAVAIAALGELPDAVLILVGDGPDRADLQTLARRAGVANRVRFLGARPHAELPGLLAAADVAVQPSGFEGIANVWIEAMACGTPVVTCDVGGAGEAIDRPAAGRLVQRDPVSFAAAIGDLLADPPSQAEVRASAERFSWERNGAELFDHLSGIVAGSKACARSG